MFPTWPAARWPPSRSISATALFLPANPNPTPSPGFSLSPLPATTSGELHFRLRPPRHARSRTSLPAAYGRGSPAAGRKEKDYYATLNIRRDATLQEVKAAYRTLARKVVCSLPLPLPFSHHVRLGYVAIVRIVQFRLATVSMWWTIVALLIWAIWIVLPLIALKCHKTCWPITEQCTSNLVSKVNPKSVILLRDYLSCCVGILDFRMSIINAIARLLETLNVVSWFVFCCSIILIWTRALGLKKSSRR